MDLIKFRLTLILIETTFINKHKKSDSFSLIKHKCVWVIYTKFQYYSLSTFAAFTAVSFSSLPNETADGVRLTLNGEMIMWEGKFFSKMLRAFLLAFSICAKNELLWNWVYFRVRNWFQSCAVWRWARGNERESRMMAWMKWNWENNFHFINDFHNTWASSRKPIQSIVYVAAISFINIL